MIQKIDSKMVNEIKTQMIEPSEFTGIKTGFNNLDYFTDGFANGDLIIMGARPSMGKTTFALSLVDNICVRDGKSCVLFTSEMPTNQVIERIIRLHGNVKYNEGDGDGYADKVMKSADDVKKARLWIDDTCVGEPDEFVERCRQIGKDERIDIIMIDYLQLFESETKHLEVELQRLKELAVELNCPVFVLSQLKRSVEKRKDHFPQISDFPLPKLIEVFADEILFLYRDAYYNHKADKNTATISVARHKKYRRMNTSIYYDPDIPMFRTDLCFYKENE